MSGRGRDDDANQEPSDANTTTGRGTDDLVHQDSESEAMNALLEAMRTVAREDEAEISTFSAELADVDQAVSEKSRARITTQILRSQATARTRQMPGQVLPKTATAATAATILRIDGGQVSRVPRRRRRLFLAAAGGLAAAAGLALWSRPSALPMTLPPYTIVATGGDQDSRGGTDKNVGGDETTTTPQRLRAESELVVAIRPETAVSGPVTARAFLVQGQAITEALSTTQIAPSGAVELRFRGADLVDKGHGPAVMRVVVGRPSALRTLDLRATGPTVTGATDWRVLTVPLELGQP